MASHLTPASFFLTWNLIQNISSIFKNKYSLLSLSLSLSLSVRKFFINNSHLLPHEDWERKFFVILFSILWWLDIRSKPKMTHRAINTSVLASLRWAEDSLWCQDVFYLFLFIDGHFRHVPLCFIGCGTLFYRTPQWPGGWGPDWGGYKTLQMCWRISAVQRRIN